MNFIRKILFPLSLLYGLVTLVRNYLYDIGVLKSTTFKTPTIVVGNISVGGTGKTPQIEYLIRLLQNDYRVAVLSRGYKRKSKGFVLADEEDTSETLGDEPYQMFKKFPDIQISVDENRVRGIKQLEKLESRPDVILLDDAFQHRKVNGGLNILLTSYGNLYAQDFVLPTGNLREFSFGAKRAQTILVTKCPEDLSERAQNDIIKKLKPTINQQVFFTSIDYDKTLKGDAKCDIADLKNSEFLLVSGIANPKPLEQYLKNKGLNFKHLDFPDHYDFKQQDIDKIERSAEALSSKNKIILTTEKDYVRIFGRLKNLYYISIKTTFINNKKGFDALVENYVGKSSRNS